MANIPIPQTVAYPALLTPRASRLRTPAPAAQDDMFVSFGVAWSTDGGPNMAVALDLAQTGAVQPLTQMVAAYVDNSRCNVDVQIICQATQSSVFVPARSQGMYPLVAEGTQLVMVATGAGFGDLTFGQIFNFSPRPVAINETAFAAAATNGNNILTSTGLQTTPMMGAGRSGVITSATVMLIGATGGASSATGLWSLVDGTPTTLLTSNFFLRNAVNYDDTIIYSASGLNIPFHNGLNFTSQVTVTAAAAGNIQAIVTVR